MWMPKVNQNFVHHYKNSQITLTRDEVILIIFTTLASSQQICNKRQSYPRYIHIFNKFTTHFLVQIILKKKEYLNHAKIFQGYLL
jgi:hypothetical protein